MIHLQQQNFIFFNVFFFVVHNILVPHLAIGEKKRNPDIKYGLNSEVREKGMQKLAWSIIEEHYPELKQEMLKYYNPDEPVNMFI